MSIKLGQLAQLIDAELVGDPQCEIHRVGTLKRADQGTLSFLTNSRYRDYLQSTQASAVLIKERDRQHCPTNALICHDPHVGYAKAINEIYPAYSSTTFHQGRNISISASSVIGKNSVIGEYTVVGDDVVIGESCLIGAGCVIGDHVHIGDHVRLVANVTLCDHVVLGAYVTVHPGVVIGADGFGFAKDQDGWIKIPQIGGVRIGNHVEIGANTTIDRGAIEDTVIGSGVKLDNQIQIAHNVIIGDNTLIAGCSAIAGSTKINQRCLIGGDVSIAGHLSIVDDVVITGGSTILQSLHDPGVYSSGLKVVMEHTKWKRWMVYLKKIDKIMGNFSKDLS